MVVKYNLPLNPTSAQNWNNGTDCIVNFRVYNSRNNTILFLSDFFHLSPSYLVFMPYYVDTPCRIETLLTTNCSWSAINAQLLALSLCSVLCSMLVESKMKCLFLSCTTKTKQTQWCNAIITWRVAISLIKRLVTNTYTFLHCSPRSCNHNNWQKYNFCGIHKHTTNNTCSLRRRQMALHEDTDDLSRTLHLHSCVTSVTPLYCMIFSTRFHFGEAHNTTFIEYLFSCVYSRSPASVPIAWLQTRYQVEKRKKKHLQAFDRCHIRCGAWEANVRVIVWSDHSKCLQVYTRR
jgi:hypothetical protein